MTLIDLNFIQFYKLLIEASLFRKRMWKTSNAYNLTIVKEKKQIKAFELKNEWDALCDNNIIKFDNMINISFRRHLNPLRESTSNLQEVKTNLECKMFNALSHTILINTDIFKKVCNIDILNCVIIEHHNNFPTLKELLFNAEKLLKLE